jgi:hypothetical protein
MGHTVGVKDAFPIVIIGISLLAIVIAVVATFACGGVGGLYERIGRGGFSMDGDEMQRRPGPAPGSPAARAEAAEEIRQLVEAKSNRRVARGEAPLDVEAEVAKLTQATASPADAELREEVRQLVIARNERRVRQGKEPVDVDTEVERQLRELGG